MRARFRALSLRLLLLAALAPGALWLALPASGHHGTNDDQRNMFHVANSPLAAPEGEAPAISSDLAFWGNLLYAGNYNGFRIIDVSNPSAPRQLVDFECIGAQSDVGVWDTGSRRLLFQSVDRRQTEEQCSENDPTRALGWEGVRIFDVSDPRRPRFLKGVLTDCGSHTHTVVPDPDPSKRRVFIYVSSYPLQEHGTHDDPDEENTAQCSVPHAKISIIEVPYDRPQDARVVNKPSTGAGSVGCHDIGVYTKIRKAAAACLTEGQIWDISNPANPVIEQRIRNPAVNIWHSGSFTWDGKVAIFGDEEGGAAATHGCGGSPPGATWFYRVSDTSAPLGYFLMDRPQLPGGELICTTHNYNPIPVTDRYLLTSAFYQAGTGVIDFSEVARLEPDSSPGQVGREIAYFDARGGDRNPNGHENPGPETWSSYWYNGVVYANDINRGVDVFRLTGQPATFVSSARRFGHLNPQTQESLDPPTRAQPRPRPRRLRLSVRPRRTRTGRRTCFTFTVRDQRGRRVRRATVRFSGSARRTSRRGRARICKRFRRAGRKRATARKAGYRSARTSVLVRRRPVVRFTG